MHAATSYTPVPLKAEPLLLVEEISHRVINEYAQAIAGIRLAAREVASDEAQAALAAAASRLLSFAEAHRALQAPILSGNVDLAETLSRLCATMSVARLQERGIRLTLSAASVLLAADRCWRVALIVCELITNGMRHGLRGGPGNIRVEMEADDQTIICRVVNDGCGKGTIKPGRGFDVVTGLANEMGGGVGWCFAPDSTSAELIFPTVTPEQLK
jgi:two-component sensor histidine kinase